MDTELELMPETADIPWCPYESVCSIANCTPYLDRCDLYKEFDDPLFMGIPVTRYRKGLVTGTHIRDLTRGSLKSRNPYELELFSQTHK